MNDFSNYETTKHEPAHVMKTPIHSPILKAAVLSLAGATPTLAVLVPSSFPSHADLQAPSSVVSPPVAGQPRTPEVAALSNTSVKAQRPSGVDRRKFGKRNRGSFVV